MIQAFGTNLYNSKEVAELLGVTRETLASYAKRAGVADRRVQRVRYYTEDEIRQIIRVPGGEAPGEEK